MIKKGEPQRALYHMPFCPLSRKIAWGLREKSITFQENLEKTWSPSRAFLGLNPMGEIPTFVEESLVFSNEYVIWEYLEDAYPQIDLRGTSPSQRAKTRHLVSLFDRPFYQEVYFSLFYERVLKPHIKREAPNTQILKTGRLLLRDYMAFMEKITEASSYLCGQNFSWADITAASHLSCIDYLGDIVWQHFPFTKEWYVKIKSRPTFRPFLFQTFPGLAPSSHYTLLDF